MIKDGKGGANTQTGLLFEKKTDLKKLFEQMNGYSLRQTNDKSGYEVYFQNQLVAHCFKQYEFYHFLNRYHIDWQEYLSRQLLPDNALFVCRSKTLFVIEVKYQEVPGSVDEKPQTCDFKRTQYTKLVQSLGWRVEYVYVFNNWFEDPKYKDTLDYIHSMNCHYMFNTIPLKWFGLPDK